MSYFKKLFSSNSRADSKKELVFDSGKAAYKYACAYMDSTLREGVSIPALVVDAKEFASEIGESVKTESDLSQLVMIRVASKNGGFVIPAKTAGSTSSVRPDLLSQSRSSHGHPNLKPGDLVSFTAMSYSDEMAEAFGSQEAGWVGFITSKLEPRLDIRDEPSIWQMEEKFYD